MQSKPPSTLSSVILWSVISAAFIGPGTVTTAVAAGSQFQLDLLWSVTFATVGCIILQEISARITIASGLTLGESMTRRFGVERGRWIRWIVGGSVVLGCAAYEAGNILGAVAGLNLMTGWDGRILTVISTLAAGLVLWVGGKNWISNLMMLLVVIMGIAFAALAVVQPIGPDELARALVVPQVPLGSELIVLGLIGTTIVPYNVFIGSGISKGQTIPLMRVGLSVSVAIGGLITAAILIAGTSIKQFGSFPELASAMSANVGPWGAIALAAGLFAAGFSSAITSPYASSLIATNVFGFQQKKHIRTAWMAVLLTGFAFGISGIRPIPVILAVQAINGLILPLLTIYLVVIVNDHRIVGRAHVPGKAYNGILLLILFTVVLMGLNNLDKSISTWLQLSTPHLVIVTSISLAVTLYTLWLIWKSSSELSETAK